MKRFGFVFALFCALTLNTVTAAPAPAPAPAPAAAPVEESKSASFFTLPTANNAALAMAAATGVTATGAAAYAAYLQLSVISELQAELDQIHSKMAVRNLTPEKLNNEQQEELARLQRALKETQEEANIYWYIAGGAGATCVVGGVAYWATSEGVTPVPEEAKPAKTGDDAEAEAGAKPAKTGDDAEAEAGAKPKAKKADPKAKKA